MEYRSDIAIAVHKKIIALDLINPIIPEVLKKEPYEDREDVRYWFLSRWKFYGSYPEVQAIQEFFAALDEMDQVEAPNSTYTFAPYGALRIGENDDDVEYWGDPNEYRIFLSRSIDSPFTG